MKKNGKIENGKNVGTKQFNLSSDEGYMHSASVDGLRTIYNICFMRRMLYLNIEIDSQLVRRCPVTITQFLLT